MDENKDITIKDFVLEYKNFMSKEWCEEIIKFFNYTKECGLTYTRKNSNGEDIKNDYVNDTACHIPIDNDYGVLMHSKLSQEFINKFYKDVLSIYSKKYSIILNPNTKFGILSLKIQRTLPSEGYHAWHYEDGLPSVKHRIATFVLYLNNVEEGGETEFLYYPKRVKPEQGKLIFWPAGYTHTHRGNQPLSGEKYILTSWLEFTH